MPRLLQAMTSALFKSVSVLTGMTSRSELIQHSKTQWAISFVKSATATYLDGEATALMKLDPCAIAHIADGELIDIRNVTETNIMLHKVRVVNVNPVDYTIVIACETGTTKKTAPTSKGSLNNFFDPSQDYFSIATADRLNATYRTLMPMRIDAAAGGSDVQLTEDHFRQAGEAVGWANGSYLDADKRVVVMNRDQYRAVNLLQKDSGMTILPALQSDVGKEMNKAFGFDGWTMHDPTLGTVALSVDDMAAYGVIDFLDMSTWEMVEPFPGGSSFDFMPGTMAKIWNRSSYSSESTAQAYDAKYNGRPSKEFEAQGEQLYAWLNTGPKRNVRIMGLDSTL